jgi:hypothetical protein
VNDPTSPLDPECPTVDGPAKRMPIRRATELLAAGTPDRRHSFVTVAIALGLPILYGVFIAHFGVNVPFWDEWDSMPIIHAAIHGHLTWSLLWTQHNENRMLFPNLAFCLFGVAGHYNVKAILCFDAALLSFGWALLLGTFRSYAGRWPGPLATLLLGAVWFSLADHENALWAFQLAWYLVLFCLMAMTFCLARRRLSRFYLLIAVAVAVVASFSSLQGLFLWPAGLISLLWRIRDRRQRVIAGVLWIAAGAATTIFYFWRFDFRPESTGGGSESIAIQHPFETVRFFLAVAGNVFPTDDTSAGIYIQEVVGTLLCVIAVYVVHRSWLGRSRNHFASFPISLVLFAFIFDASIAVGRVSLSVATSQASRYTMPNLVLLIAILACVFRGDLPRRRGLWMGVASSNAHQIARGLIAVLLMVQIVASTQAGLDSAAVSLARGEVAARTLANLPKIPVADRIRLESQFVYPWVAPLQGFLLIAEQDHLSVFAPSVRAQYAIEGPPR